MRSFVECGDMAASAYREVRREDARASNSAENPLSEMIEVAATSHNRTGAIVVINLHLMDMNVVILYQRVFSLMMSEFRFIAAMNAPSPISAGV